jgi:hypothetical protein
VALRLMVSHDLPFSLGVFITNYNTIILVEYQIVNSPNELFMAMNGLICARAR